MFLINLIMFILSVKIMNFNKQNGYFYEYLMHNYDYTLPIYEYPVIIMTNPFIISLLVMFL